MNRLEKMAARRVKRIQATEKKKTEKLKAFAQRHPKR